MPLNAIPLPSVWDIPVAAGVPALLGQSVSTGIKASASTILATALDEYTISTAASHWGIFTTGNQPVITSGHVRALGVQSMYRVSDGPQEHGSFLSYNKVRIPGQYEVEMLCDGSSFEYGNASVFTDLLSVAGLSGAPSTISQTKALFMAALDRAVASLDLYLVSTPDVTYQNANIIGYQMRREAHRGASVTTRAIRSLMLGHRATGRCFPFAATGTEGRTTGRRP
ncbi:hypothetical protein [Acetobacter indonesiensis]|uniref:hypothetical protein n=1 Tax=Acetobacter indonesiensis TaxID=104101 RepID=UPI0020A48D18|nr:hypothetical protein [Acetobacter indonesiensis]MCP1229837.1 hypothetical protein [Acetobacter indonesiensis]